MSYAKGLAPVAVLVVVTFLLVSCSIRSTADGGPSSQDVARGLNARGPITYAQGKDDNNVVRPLVEKWNSAHPAEKVTFKEQSGAPEQLHDDLVAKFQTKKASFDVVSIDVTWTAELAANGWLQPLTGSALVDTLAMVPATVRASTYKNVLYAAPVSTDAGILYYRKDLVPNPPKTWDEMMGMCSIAKANNIGCYAGQFAKYEGLTANVAEAISSAGGTILGPDGKPTLSSAAAERGLQNLVTAYANGNIPKEATTYQEEQGRTAFEDGQLLFLRNWPYMYNLARFDDSSKVKDTFGIAAMPGPSGPGASSLGGHSAAISVYSGHKATAADFLRFLTSDGQQRAFATEGYLTPVLSALYDDPVLVAQLPYLTVLKSSMNNANALPTTPFYPAVSKAVQDNAFAAITGVKPVKTALFDMTRAIDSARAP